MRYAIQLLLFSILLSCETTQTPFEHAIENEKKPWNHESFDAGSDRFTFAIFSDLTGGERNRIFDVAIEQINLLRPEFIINVGDLIDGGVSEEIEWNKQWELFDERAGKAIAPVFYVGGNHDLTGEMAQGVWKERFGESYYHFVYKNVLFMVLDTEDNTPARIREIETMRNEALAAIDSGGWEAFGQTAYAGLPERTHGNIGEQQASYFKQVIAMNTDVRYAFLFMHKPIWQKENEQNFSQIEEALTTIPYTVFHGHTHFYQYGQRNGRDYINLSTTGGGQVDESGRSVDHITLVTVQGNSTDIANILLEGILDKTGHIPNGGDTLKYEGN